MAGLSTSNTEEKAQLQASAAAEAPAQSRQILIAEDNELSQRVILRQLNLLGYAGAVAGNGVEALRLWREGDYALLLTDLHMPEMDGYALAKNIRREEQGQRRIPILVLTAHALTGEADRALSAGVDEYLTKPVPLRLLQTTLGKWLSVWNGMQDMPATATAAATSVDAAALAALIGNDPQTMREFFADYLVAARKLAEELHAAFSAGDIRQVIAVAHKLKSSSRSVGALRFGDSCAELETAGKAGAKTAIDQKMRDFEAAMAAVEREIRQFLQEH